MCITTCTCAAFAVLRQSRVSLVLRLSTCILRNDVRARYRCSVQCSSNSPSCRCPNVLRLSSAGASTFNIQHRADPPIRHRSPSIHHYSRQLRVHAHPPPLANARLLMITESKCPSTSMLHQSFRRARTNLYSIGSPRIAHGASYNPHRSPSLIIMIDLSSYCIGTPYQGGPVLSLSTGRPVYSTTRPRVSVQFASVSTPDTRPHMQQRQALDRSTDVSSEL